MSRKLTDKQEEAKVLRQVAAFIWTSSPAQTGLDQYHHDTLLRMAAKLDPKNVAEIAMWPGR